MRTTVIRAGSNLGKTSGALTIHPYQLQIRARKRSVVLLRSHALRDCFCSVTGWQEE
jgi:hypothetical protein